MRTVAMVVVVLLGWPASAREVRADIISACGAPGYHEPVEVATAADVARRVGDSDVPEEPRGALADRWLRLVDDNARVGQHALDFDDVCLRAKERADGIRARIDQFNGSCTGEGPPDWCPGEHDAVQAAYAAAEAEAVALDAQLEALKQEYDALVVGLGDFAGDGERELLRWFTGKKVYHLTAKSWIDGSAITEVSLRAFKLWFEGDAEPTSPSSRGDYRLYQTFVVEVVFLQGKIKTAKFLKPSLQQDGGTTQVPLPVEPRVTVSPDGVDVHLVTVGFKGKIYVVDQKVAIAADRLSVRFTRKVEGHPNLFVLTLDKVADTATWVFKLMSKKRFGSLGNLPTIWNSLSVEIDATEVRPSGDGSGFPSHRFWIGDEMFDSRVQSDPSEYFHDD